MSCTPATLLSSASAFTAYNPLEQQLMRLAMLCAISEGTSMACNPATLLAAGQIYNNYTPAQQRLIEIELLCSIMSGGGGGGGGGSGSVLQGHGDPVSAPSNAANPAVYTDLDSGIGWYWNVETQAWA